MLTLSRFGRRAIRRFRVMVSRHGVASWRGVTVWRHGVASRVASRRKIGLVYLGEAPGIGPP
jgi:hypothetical protein